MSKKSREAIRNNLERAIAPPTSARKRGANLDGLLEEYAPPEAPKVRVSEVPQSVSLPTAPPPDGGATSDVAPPQNDQPPLQNVAPTPDTAPTPRVEATRYTSIPNDIFDAVLPTLKPVEQVVLLRLYRLTRGFQNARCTVSIGTLAKRCAIGTTAARNAAQELERRGFIRRLGADLMNSNQQARGVEFEMILPAAASTRDAPPTRRVAPTHNVAPTRDVANKVNTQKEITQTQAGVSVGSKFTLEECRRYAEHLRITGQGITNPGGYATTIHRTGEADALIEPFLTPELIPTEPQVDISQCPDCHGTGFWYPKGQEAGVAKCKHERLAV
jgi:DNA-binding Lrp family transcriptional regulator